VLRLVRSVCLPACLQSRSLAETPHAPKTDSSSQSRSAEPGSRKKCLIPGKETKDGHASIYDHIAFVWLLVHTVRVRFFSRDSIDAINNCKLPANWDPRSQRREEIRPFS